MREEECDIIKATAADLDKSKKELQHQLMEALRNLSVTAHDNAAALSEARDNYNKACGERDAMQAQVSQLRDTLKETERQRDEALSHQGEDTHTPDMEGLEKTLIRLSDALRVAQQEISRLENVVHKECLERMKMKEYIERLESRR
jgi:hypothetical protein